MTLHCRQSNVSDLAKCVSLQCCFLLVILTAGAAQALYPGVLKLNFIIQYGISFRDLV